MLIAPSAIREICRKTDRRLWNAYGIHEGKLRPEEPFSRLLFPTDANGDIRVSEQEARFAFLESVLESGFFYSVETPTSKKYRISGKGSRAAQTDFTICNEYSERILNVEFKAGTDFRIKGGIPVYKDVQKLLHEPVSGMWFHLIKSVKALDKVLDKLSSEFSKGLCALNLDWNENDRSFLFHICVLQQEFSIHKEINFFQRSHSHEREFEFSYKDFRPQFDGSDNPNKWNIHQNNY